MNDAGEVTTLSLAERIREVIASGTTDLEILTSLKALVSGEQARVMAAERETVRKAKRTELMVEVAKLNLAQLLRPYADRAKESGLLGITLTFTADSAVSITPVAQAARVPADDTRTVPADPYDSRSAIKPAAGPHLAKSYSTTRRRDVELEDRLRGWVVAQLRARGVRIEPPDSRKAFRAGGKQGVLCVSATPPDAQNAPFFGFPDALLRSGVPTLVVAVVAVPDAVAFVVPYEGHREFFNNLSIDGSGGRKFSVRRRSGSYWMMGGGSRLALEPFVNAFGLFEPGTDQKETPGSSLVGKPARG